MKRTIQNVLTGVLVSLLAGFLASCQDLTGPQGEPGADGRDAAIVQDTAYAVKTALAGKTGGGEEPWVIRVSGVDISDANAFRHIISGIAAALEGDIALDLSECTGTTFAHVDGINWADKLRIVSLILPGSLTHIVDGREGYGAFHNYRRLGSVSAPGLAYIGDYAFTSYRAVDVANEALTEVDFPEVLHVGAYAFYYCVSLSSINLPRAERIGDYAFNGNSSSFSLTEVNLPSARSIGERAFYRWRSIESIHLPEVITIGNYAFYTNSPALSNTALTGLSLPRCETIGDYAFGYYPNLATLELPAVKTIGSAAFSAGSAAPNTGLTTVNLQNVETIGTYAFQYCTGLTTITLPLVKTIGNYAFQYCPAITTISLPSVTSIGSYAFRADSAAPNTGLTTLDLATVTAIGNRAFEYCTGLTTLKLGPTVPTTPDLSTTAGNGIFLQTGSTGTINIQVPNDKQNDYTAAGWKAIAQGAAAVGTINFGTSHKAITISTYN